MSSSSSYNSVAAEESHLDGATTPAYPGKRSLTQSIGPSMGSLADRVASVLQRRADGAAAGGGAGGEDETESAVAAASSSTGAPLRADVREKFEGSLGADLSAVRVHTGDESATAAKSVGAHAYATGNDIHFAQGMYQPDDPFGLHLLAHEVAHTVQQAGGGFASRQHKVEVSSPGDAAEHEADRAADAMVSGARARISNAPIALARKPAIESDRHGYEGKSRHGFRFSEMPGIKENPACPWNHGPNDYVAVGAAMPPAAGPPAEVPSFLVGTFPEPLNAIGSDGKPYELPPASTVERANSAIDALLKVTASVRTVHNSMVQPIRDYATASEQVKPGGTFGQAPAGLNWAAPKDGGSADAGQLAEKQVPIGGKASIGEAFNKDNKAAVGDKTVSDGKTQAVSALLETARDKDLTVGTSITAYRQHIRNEIGGAVVEVQNAYVALQKKEQNDNAENAGEKKEMLEFEKKEALEVIGAAGKAIESGSKALEHEPGAVRELIMLAAERVVSHEFDHQIKAQITIIQQAKGKIRALDQTVVQNGIKTAEAKLQTAMENLEGKRIEVVKALKARQDAYDAAAAKAKEQAVARGANPQDAERLQTAIMAIPRIEVVLTKLKQITEQAVVPTYDPTAGLAYAVARNGNRGIDAPAFERAIGAIKFNREHYAAEQATWQGRLDSARAVEAGLNVTATKSK